METLEPDNLIEHATGDASLRPPYPAGQDSRLSASRSSPASRGFSLSITLRLKPFVFAIGVTPAPEADRSLGHTI